MVCKDRCVELPPREMQCLMRLRNRMTEAGCEFKFSVMQLPAEWGDATDSDHRQVLHQVCESIRTDWPSHRFDIAAASPVALASERVKPRDQLRLLKGLVLERSGPNSSWFEQLQMAVEDPPFHANCDLLLVQDLLDQCGLVPLDGLVVLDWVGDPALNPDRSRWSDFFDAGKEWWGIWCLSVWNPRRRTVAVLMASETD